MSVGQDVQINTSVVRNDNPAILACDRHLCVILPVRLGYDAAGYVAGTVLGKTTSDGLFYKYNDAHSDGTEVAKCVLFTTVLDMPASGTALERGIFSGLVWKDKLTGLDANGETDLGGKELVDSSGLGTVLKF